jgi:hypothetical protein
MAKEGLLEKFARSQFEKVSISNIPIDEAFILNTFEINAIRKIRNKALLFSALLGALGVLFLYLPQYAFPSFFPETTVVLFGFNMQLPLVGWLYALVLVIIEIYCLNIVNIQAVARIAAACNFPNKESKDYDLHLNALLGAALEKPATNINQFGINPFLGLPKYSYTFYVVFAKLKATLSNALVKILVSRLLGRVAVRQVTDMVGIPIFAFWNAYATHLVIKESILRIMAPDTINNFVNNLYENYKNNEAFKTLAKDALQYTAILKRNYNYAHYLLAHNVLNTFNINDENYTGDFVHNYNLSNANVKEGLLKLIIVGVAIDGKISLREENQLLNILDENSNYTIEKIKAIAKNYNDGKGLVLLEANLKSK